MEKIDVRLNAGSEEFIDEPVLEEIDEGHFGDRLHGLLIDNP